MPEYLTPGVYVEELNTGNKPIEGVSTSTVGFLGVAERGPGGPGSAKLITSYTVSVVRWFETLLAFWSGGSGSLGCGLNYAAFS